MSAKAIITGIIALMLLGCPYSGHAQRKANDKEKQRQWRSMENGPWDFAPDWYYFLLHKKYSGAEMYWKWAGFQSGFRVRFKEHKSKVEEERQKMEELYQEELLREADRNVDLMFPSYKDEFNRMQDCITDGLLYCMQKSKGKLQYQVDELSRQNEILCADIAYIHKMGVGYGLENAKRQKAYEEARQKMEELVKRTANLCAVASTHY